MERDRRSRWPPSWWKGVNPRRSGVRPSTCGQASKTCGTALRRRGPRPPARDPRADDRLAAKRRAPDFGSRDLGHEADVGSLDRDQVLYGIRAQLLSDARPFRTRRASLPLMVDGLQRLAPHRGSPSCGSVTTTTCSVAGSPGPTTCCGLELVPHTGLYVIRLMRLSRVHRVPRSDADTQENWTEAQPSTREASTLSDREARALQLG